MKAYIIHGTTNSHFHTYSWNVSVFLNQELAYSKCDKMNKWLIDNKLDRYPSKDILKCPYDDKFVCYTYGVVYYVDEVELELK